MAEITYTGDRPELLRFLDVQGRGVLDVGCGGGGLAPHLRRAGATTVVGVEAERSHAATANSQCDRVIEAPIETALADRLLGHERFGLILLADVLEHLVDPWATLRELTSQLLTRDGHVFVSVPNVASLTVVKQLLRRRDWSYDDFGMFDRTHLRWFGKDTLRELLDQASLRPISWGGRVAFQLGPIRYSRIRWDVSRVPPIAIYQFYILAARDL